MSDYNWDFNTIFVFLSFFGLIIKWFLDLGKSVPLKPTILLIASFQLLLCPLLDYHIFQFESHKSMSVDENTYFNFISPAFIFFGLGLYVKLNQIKDRDLVVNLKTKSNAIPVKIIFPIIFFSILISFVSPYVPANLNFVVYIIENLRYIGVFYLLFSNQGGFKNVYLYLVYFLVVSVAIQSGMFHDLIVWVLFYMIYYFLSKEIKHMFVVKLLSLLILVSFIYLIQSTKSTYRDKTWGAGSSEANISTFINSSKDGLAENVSFSSFFELNNERFNQGLIVAKVMDYTPRFEPFANGEIVFKAIYGGFLPRFLDENKAKAGGKDNILRFAGIDLTAAAMTLSVFGDAYCDFGVVGGIVFMFFYGLFLNFIISMFNKNSINYPTLFLWLPLVFFYAIRAENDFQTCFNHILKTSLVIWFIFKFYNTELRNNK
jgi:hypothetical protein